jgi:hypothetical protein
MKLPALEYRNLLEFLTLSIWLHSNMGVKDNIPLPFTEGALVNEVSIPLAPFNLRDLSKVEVNWIRMGFLAVSAPDLIL